MLNLAVLLSVSVAAASSATPSQRTDVILIQGNKAGSETVAVSADGSARAEYSYNDRGRGDHIVATWKLDAAGIPIEYTGSGNDYMKAAVDERFTFKDRKATWKNRTENGEKALTAPAFYVPANPPPEFYGVLARALLKAPNHTLRLLPAGEARRMAGAAPSDDDHCSPRRQRRTTTEDGRPGRVHAPTIRAQAFRPRAQDAVPRRSGCPPPRASGPGAGRRGRGTSAGSRPPRAEDPGRANGGAVRPTAAHRDHAVARVRNSCLASFGSHASRREGPVRQAESGAVPCTALTLQLP